MRSARKVARAKGILEGGGGRRIDIDKFKAFDWPGLIAYGGIVRRRITNADVDRQLTRAGAGPSKDRVAEASFIDLYTGLVTPAMVEDAAGRIRNSKVAILEGVGHFPHTEAPERFNEAVGEFLALL